MHIHEPNQWKICLNKNDKKKRYIGIYEVKDTAESNCVIYIVKSIIAEDRIKILNVGGTIHIQILFSVSSFV